MRILLTFLCFISFSSYGQLYKGQAYRYTPETRMDRTSHQIKLDTTESEIIFKKDKTTYTFKRQRYGKLDDKDVIFSDVCYRGKELYMITIYSEPYFMVVHGESVWAFYMLNK
jgi:hypothetical protein